LLKAGGTTLLMYVHNDGTSCLYAAAKRGHSAVAEVYVCGGRQERREGVLGSDGTRHMVQGL
jgi:hypothetical protein